MASPSLTQLVWRDTLYGELYNQGYPQETFGQQVSEATRVLLVPWARRQQARLDFLGYSIGVPGGTASPGSGSSAYVQRVTPAYHPDYLTLDGSPYLWADSVTFEPFGQAVDDNGNPFYGDGAAINTEPSFGGFDADTPMYGYAKMTVHYATRLYTVMDDDTFIASGGAVLGDASLSRYVEIPFSVAAQYLSLPDGSLAFAQDGFSRTYNINGLPTTVLPGPVPGAPGKIEGQWDITIIWRQVPPSMIASAAVQTLFGNESATPAAFDYAIGRTNWPAFCGYPPGTLLCEPMELTPWIQADGGYVYDVTFHLKYFSRGWNYLLQRGGGAAPLFEYAQVGVANSLGAATYIPAITEPQEGQQLYDSYDLRKLFYGYSSTASLVQPPT